MSGYIKILLLSIMATVMFSAGFCTKAKFDLAAQATADNQALQEASAAAIKANARATLLESTLSTYQSANQKLQEKIHEKVLPANDCALSTGQLSALHTYSINASTRR